MFSLYYICPIDRNHEHGHLTMNTKEECTIFLPTTAYMFTGRPDPKFIVQVNIAAMVAADAILINYVPGIESWGMPMEMLLLSSLQPLKPIAVVVGLSRGGTDSGMPVYLSWVLERLQANILYDTDDAVDWLAVQVEKQRGNSND